MQCKDNNNTVACFQLINTHTKKIKQKKEILTERERERRNITDSHFA